MAQSSAPRPPGSAYFEKKGEVHELRQLLRGAAADRDQQKKRDAIKKVIAYMTLGIDVSPLFSEMVMASATSDLVQKKMVYLYLVNYAESNSELAILAVNTLQKDCRDDDPMIRGLALRSLCSLNLLNMVEYLQPAVQRALEDINGYVRKTAVIGVLKVFHISKSAVLESDLLPTLKRLIHDQDAHVVSNAICAIDEVLAEEGGVQPTREMVTNMLNRLNQFSEWGQCSVLRLLTKYQVADEGEMFDIMNILDSLLKQSSSAVVLAVTKIFVDLTSNRPDLQLEVLRRLKGPLLTLMAASTPELAYTVLVHIQALCSRGGENLEVFGPEFKQFFCRDNEPSYIKTVKIEILMMLADVSSSEPIVAELSEYVTNVDVEISRRAIRAIGKIAVRVPSTAEMIVGSLTSLLELDIDYVSTEAAVVMKDLVRKYPQQFQRASGAVERCIKIVSEPEGKCAVLWILGEYGLLIEDAPYLLEPMIDGFLEEPSGSVRLEMLTAAVKLFFCRPPEMQDMLGRLLEKAIQESTHPDMRDRALLYYRLLEHSPEEARRIICAPKEVVEEFQEEMDADARDRVFEEFNTLSTVYKQPASKFVLAKGPLVNLGVSKMQPPPSSGDPVDDRGAGGDEANGFDSTPAAAPAPPVQTRPSMAETADLLGGMDTTPARPAPPAPAQQPPAAGLSDLLGMDDLLGGGDSLAAAPAPPPPAAPAFTLAFGGVSMDGDAFQARWAQLPQLPMQQRQMRPGAGPLTTAAIEEVLRRAGVFVIASGMIPPGQAMKFYFYARQATGPSPVANGNIWFLTELVVVPGGNAQCSVKAENAQVASVEQYSALLWQTLSTYVC
mmetsp:Transcript_122521/g.357768  ORF Transcript_122521/g.357768 Transcript_122521/m.357768 type:complete len:838 (-) Transcript_122521:218-2731(-)